MTTKASNTQGVVARKEGDLVDLLERLSNADALPGLEEEVRAIFVERWGEVTEVAFDRLGGVVAEVEGAEAGAPRVAVECHLDEVGFMVRLITRAGMLKIAPLGGFWSQVLPAQRIRLLTRGRKIPGVIGATPPHLLGRDRDKAVDVKDLQVDVGASSRAEAEGMGLRPGTFAVPDSAFTPLINGARFAGKAFDNRVGCAVCLHTVLEAARAREAGEPWAATVVGVGSVQEEVGLRGVRTSAAVARPDVAIVVEGSPADDLTSAAEEVQGRLGGGVQIRAFDPTMVASPQLVELALEVAEALDIPHQLAVRTTGGTDAGQLHLHGVGVPTIVVAVPVRYAHSHVGVIDLGDLEAMAWLVRALLKELTAEVVASRLLPWAGR